MSAKVVEILGPYLESDTVRAYAVAFAVGISLHAWVLRVGEWDTYSLPLFAMPFVVPAVLSAAMAHLRPERAVGATVANALRLDAALLGGVVASMLVYRALLHRLAEFPGPFAARLSKFYMLRQAVRLGLRPFDEVRRLHAAHGDFVRTGPAEVSVVDPRAFRDVHANSTRCNKGVWYTIGEPHVNLHMTRDRKEHAHRRRIWDQAFSSKGE
jgi:cytochrome P450 family 628